MEMLLLLLLLSGPVSHELHPRPVASRRKGLCPTAVERSIHPCLCWLLDGMAFPQKKSKVDVEGL
jgi:hypothetical protein